jgi:hypothetical protein
MRTKQHSYGRRQRLVPAGITKARKAPRRRASRSWSMARGDRESWIWFEGTTDKTVCIWCPRSGRRLVGSLQGGPAAGDSRRREAGEREGEEE